MKEFQKKLSNYEYTTKGSVAVLYALLAAIALNLFWQPGHIYASGVTGIAQIVTTVMGKWLGQEPPVSVIYYALNIPLFIVAWRKISKKFTIFTFITVTLATVAIQLVPVTTLTNDPIICAIFGGAINGFAIGLALKNGISSGGLDIISITIRQATGRNVGAINTILNGMIAFTAGYLFGWQYSFYSLLSIFVTGKVTDLVFTKQQKMQVMIITNKPEAVIESVQDRLRRGITIINDAEGAFKHDKKTILFTVITRYEMHSLEDAMEDADPSAFVSIADNVKILGNFYDPGM
ncbi:YitT family protein [Vagococcus intermedius]|uniref:YitT family protein n=1 Tax=Vagococcus intermedius TaxID=2991418 RepID=A0AAF0CUL7_9ENTE|nr:YitT family protein [Vagococcus intermedius]WEG73208.1 YitT family protein [Vagococcus intermedius]WEG75293.1 YitT family protein [Vagococcus intermedius]